MSRPVYVQEFPTPPTVGEVIELIGDEGRHAVSVKRTGVGEQIELVDGHGTRAVITVTGVSGKDRLTGVVDCVANEPASRPTVTVIQALPKAARSELTVDLLTQAGADVIVPWQAGPPLGRQRNNPGGPGSQRSPRWWTRRRWQR